MNQSESRSRYTRGTRVATETAVGMEAESRPGGEGAEKLVDPDAEHYLDGAASSGPLVDPDDPDIDLAVRIARWTDARFLDPIIGLVVPGLGDLLTAGVGLFIVNVAVARRLPRLVIARMLLNLGIDSAVGAIPIAGDLFDFVWQANRRNVELLQARHATRRSRPGDWIVVVGAAALLLAGLALPIALLVWAIKSIV
jgi:hypothetical protein